MKQDESGVAKSQHVVHVLPPGDPRVAGVIGPQVQRVTQDAEGVQLLVLTPSGEVAAWVARLVNGASERDGTLLIPVTAPSRGARLVSAGARAVAASPADALALVRGSSLKLDAVRVVVLVDAPQLLESAGEPLATLMGELPKEAERLAIAEEVDEALQDFLEAHMRRARRITHDPVVEGSGPLQYLVTDRGDRALALRRLLDRFDPPRATVLADAVSVPAATRALAAIGHGADDPLVRVRTGELDAHEPLVIAFGAPPSAGALQALLDATPQVAVVLVAPEEVASFVRLAGARATPLELSAVPSTARAAEEALRDELRAILRSRTLHREVLTLEPLLGEHDPVELAAAALRLADVERGRAHAAARAATAAGSRKAPRADEPPAVTPPTERVAPPGTRFTRLFINVGERDGARKGDFVGAITGEAGIAADQIGTIETRDSFTVVEVASEVAQQVIERLTGRTIRGRTVMAREDRGPSERPDRSERGAREGRGERGGWGDREGRAPSRGGARGTGRGPGRGFDRGGDRGGVRGGSSRGDRPDRGDRGARGPRSFGGGGGGGGVRGGDRFERGDRGPRSGFGDRDRAVERGGGRGVRGPRAIHESREWSERGDRLRHARRRRPEA